MAVPNWGMQGDMDAQKDRETGFEFQLLKCYCFISVSEVFVALTQNSRLGHIC